MDDELWTRRTVPDLDVGPSAIWSAAPADAAELSADRTRLRADVDGAEDDGLEQLLLAFEELGSNGLRHGRPPIWVTVATTRTGWLLDVADSAVDQPPTPALGRDPSHGGMGLYLVARLAAGHGWDVSEGRKHVWACFASERARPADGDGTGEHG